MSQPFLLIHTGRQHRRQLAHTMQRQRPLPTQSGMALQVRSGSHRHISSGCFGAAGPVGASHAEARRLRLFAVSDAMGALKVQDLDAPIERDRLGSGPV